LFYFIEIATGEVLVFLDSHMEVNTNWLPPLLEPIAINPTTATMPSIDFMNFDTFEYSYMTGTRGVFDDYMVNFVSIF
jgi:polypeptide N-acetylgalactosaminyltransferase